MTVVEGAFVLLDLGQHVEADAQRQVGRLLAHDLLDHLLVRRIGVRMHQADRDGLDPFRQQAVDGGLGVGARKGHLHMAARIDAFLHRDPQAALDQHRRLGPGQVVEARHAQVADFQHVAEAGGGDQPGPRALQFQDGVGRHRGAVQDLGDVVAQDAGFGQHRADALDNGAGVVVDRGRHLPGDDGTVVGQEHDVGEGAADVDAETIRAHAGSSHSTVGVSAQPRRFRMAARSVSVAAASTALKASSSTTP